MNPPAPPPRILQHLRPRGTSTNCPICRTPTFLPITLAEGLAAEHCSTCQGDWILGTVYWSWILSKPSEPLAPDAPTRLSDHRAAKLCPHCGKILRRFDFRHDLPFAVEHCATCGGFWLDAGEFRCLARHGMATKLHLIIAPDWQATLAQTRQYLAHEDLLRTHLGESDFAKLQHLKSWLDAHPRREELLAFLLSPSSADRK